MNERAINAVYRQREGTVNFPARHFIVIFTNGYNETRRKRRGYTSCGEKKTGERNFGGEISALFLHRRKRYEKK